MEEDSKSFGLLPFPVKMKHFIDSVYTKAVKDTDFRPFDLPFISVIGRFDGISQKEISARLGYDKSYTTRIINHLIENGSVENRASGKTHSLHLTEKGQEGLEIAIAVAEEIERVLFTGFTDEEKDAFIGSIDRLGDNMQAWVDEL